MTNIGVENRSNQCLSDKQKINKGEGKKQRTHAHSDCCVLLLRPYIELLKNCDDLTKRSVQNAVLKLLYYDCRVLTTV